jgi:DNA mismatch repair protein MutS
LPFDAVEVLPAAIGTPTAAADGLTPATALRSALDAIDPDALTPREALERLYELKRIADAAAPGAREPLSR